MSFSFGTPASAPATGGLTGGFSFGANKPATPGFGLASSQPSTGLFGTPTAAVTPSFGNTSFGAASTPAFGAAATTAAAPAFGSTPAFGTVSAAPSFGATTTPSFGLGAPASTAPPAFGTLGAAPAFGTAPTTGFGAGGLNFGAGTATSTPSTGLSFGQPAATSAATGLGGLGGFSFGAAPQSTSLGFGLGATTTTAGLFGKLGATSVTSSLPSTTATPSLGLGGVAPTTLGAANTASDAKSEPAKQQKLPNEIATTVDSFKEFVKKQKALSSEVMRVSVKPLHTVSLQAETTLRETGSLRGSVGVSRAASRRQRAAAAAALAAAEAAARNHAYPGSELESAAPPVYVKELISELEQQLITFRRQMDIADKQMQSEPKLLTEQELNTGLRCMHESMVGLAGRLGAAHAQVQAQKEQYLNLRKYVLKDPTDVFQNNQQSSMLDQILKDVDNCRKKTKSGVIDSHGGISDTRTALGGNISQLAGPTPFNYMGTGLSPYPQLLESSGTSWQAQSAPPALGSLNSSFGALPSLENSFQLQKPPGKRTKQ